MEADRVAHDLEMEERHNEIAARRYERFKAESIGLADENPFFWWSQKEWEETLRDQMADGLLARTIDAAYNIGCSEGLTAWDRGELVLIWADWSLRQREDWIKSRESGI